MKKILLMFSIILIVTGFLFADDRLNIATEWMTDSIYIRRFFGAYSEKDETRAENPYRYQGDGITKFFQKSMFGNGIKGRVGLAYTGEKIGGSFSLRIAEDTSFSDKVEWSSWFRFGTDNGSFNIRLLAGYNEQKGMLGNFGILFPVWRKQGNYIANNFFSTTINFPYGYANPNQEMGFVEFYMTETSDVFMPAGTNTRKLLNFLADFNFKPFTITIATGCLFAKDTIPLVNINESARGEEVRGRIYDAIYNPATIGGTNLAFRAESAQIANLVTIGVTYKYTSSIFTKIFPSDATSPFDPNTIVDENKSNHAYGLFAVISPLDILSIFAGYSGLYQTWKNPQYEHTFVAPTDIVEHWLSDYSKALHPVFHGIDLNISYTGIEKLILSFNNNLTLARVHGINSREKDDGIFSLGWAYREHLGNQTGDGKGRSERYIGLANELDLLFEFNERISFDTNISSQFGIFTLFGDAGDDPTSSSHYLNIAAGMGYAILDKNNIKGVIHLGFNIRLSNFLYQDNLTMDIFKAGLMEMAIPIVFSLRF